MKNYCTNWGSDMKKKVAFICVHNSCRSQIAEALGKHLRSDEFDFYSAYKDSQMSGFSTTSFELAGLDQDTLKGMNHTFAKLYIHYNKTAE